MKRRKVVIGLIIAAVIIVFIVVAAMNGGQSDQSSASKDGIYVKTGQVTEENLSETISTKGSVVSRDSTTIYAEVSGTVDSIEVENGASVKKGDILVKLYSESLDKQIRDAKLQLEIAELNYQSSTNSNSSNSQVKSAKASYDTAKENLNDQKVLFEAGAISEKEYETAQQSYDSAYRAYIDAQHATSSSANAVKVSELDFERSKNAYDDLLESKEKTVIRATMDGTVTGIDVHELDMINAGTAVATVETASDLQVEAYIGEYDINKIKMGQDVLVTSDSIDDAEYQGKVSFIDSKAMVQSVGQSSERSILVKVDILDSTVFKPNFTADLEITVAQSAQATAVSYDALAYENDSYFVYTIKDGKAQKHNVTLGVEGDINVEIISSDIQVGDQVVIDPPTELEDGSNVNDLGGQ